MRARRFKSSIGLVTLLLFGACGSPSPSSPAQSDPSSTESFWDLMADEGLDYVQFENVRAVWETSEVAVIGRIIRVSRGRSFGGPPGSALNVPTVLATVEVSEVVRGRLEPANQRLLYLELIVPSLVTPEQLAQTVPTEPLLVFLVITNQTMTKTEIDETGVVRDKRKTLFTIPSTKGLFVERHGDLVTPLDTTPSPYDDSYEANTLAELAEEIRGF